MNYYDIKQNYLEIIKDYIEENWDNFEKYVKEYSLIDDIDIKELHNNLF